MFVRQMSEVIQSAGLGMVRDSTTLRLTELMGKLCCIPDHVVCLQVQKYSVSKSIQAG